jgi:hypothetical protein
MFDSVTDLGVMTLAQELGHEARRIRQTALAMPRLNGAEARALCSTADAFSLSAIMTAMSLSRGVTAKAIADDAFRAVVANPLRDGELYVSGSSVGCHGRTGRVLSLPGALPEGLTPRRVQSWIRLLPASTCDRIINRAADQNQAFIALRDAVRNLARMKDAARAAARLAA